MMLAIFPHNLAGVLPLYRMTTEKLKPNGYTHDSTLQ
jgi:hypothetical protein